MFPGNLLLVICAICIVSKKIGVTYHCWIFHSPPLSLSAHGYMKQKQLPFSSQPMQGKLNTILQRHHHFILSLDRGDVFVLSICMLFLKLQYIEPSRPAEYELIWLFSWSSDSHHHCYHQCVLPFSHKLFLENMGKTHLMSFSDVWICRRI